MRYTLSTLAGATALAVSMIAGPAMAADAGIIVYNAQHESLAKEWVEGFTKETGIKVTLRNGGDSDFSNQIVAEGASSPADVFLTENSPAMTLVEAAGLFAPVDADTLAQVPAEFQPSSGRWVGVAARSTVFAYNKTKLTAEKLPKSMLDLADPSWKGRWAASPSGADFQAIVSALLELKGEAATADWLKAMKENFTAYKGNGTVMKAVNAGEIEGGIIYHYYYFGDQAKTGENSKNVELHYFKNQDPGAFVSISGGGVLASSKHPKEAQAFLKWVTGKGGQDVLKTGTSFEYAIGKDAQSNPKLVPLADLQAPKVDPATLNSKKVTDLMTAAGLL
ncbi:iron ABC transporter substrate-binding protein [Mesorhizobium sp. LSJC268A00]|uniref:iron ABC transporter substrate-binding protein n=1 Tax=unclassified Mesorhizobium TaxID=325217 RepID=UPI0003CE1DA9|nr:MULTISPECIES: iron ABC transporter substrate-binding protein [unclassified Mesorhizobium]ESW63855.1 iron ABC transporter substrate-binding protein [Mesorhizobium sp. LSJC277A00]ESW93722.1 iron ABC transporter substrate-binding protein [Mesorhizobium sp. LSJC269B00]ESW97971.1 iron ABC transporter substrate-binding protein [Mesorhizobium sp. LSJC268A00]ESX20049.1 iron ABC transporter substrate-binding protein [Mesorhizobium sp. LSJC255A00]ESX22936.1 iron ABC transporter substrate-binding prot